MTIILFPDRMQIRAEDRILTEIIRLVDGTPLRWNLISETLVRVAGEKELLYELLEILTRKFLVTIELI